MKCYVEATNLILFRDAHWSEEAQHLQDAKADHKGTRPQTQQWYKQMSRNVR